MGDHYKPVTGHFNSHLTEHYPPAYEHGPHRRNMKENSVWEVYNDEARKVDIELVKDWTASLNFLLVFASIFSAVLTAFIIESKKMLEQDSTDILVDIMIFYVNNAANTTPNSYIRPSFHPTSAAVSINCLLFASLGASLTAALASVMALQWVSNYDSVITRGGPSPEDRAKRRQFRFAGITTWRMGEIITALPLLLHSSVALFLAGATQWMWSINTTVGVIVACGAGSAGFFYAATTLLSARCYSAPFSTPLSSGLCWLLESSRPFVGRCLLQLPLDSVLRRFKLLARKIYSFLNSARQALISSSSYLDENSWFYEPEQSSSPPVEVVGDWITKYLVHRAKQEAMDAEQTLALEDQARGWLAQQLPISSHFNHQLLLIVAEICGRLEVKPLSTVILDAPWPAILDSLGRHFMEGILYGTLLKEDYEAIGVLLRWIQIPEIASRISPSESYERNAITDQYWNQHCFETAGPIKSQITSPQNLAFLLARDVPVPSPGSKLELEATIKLIRWRNEAGPKQAGIWIDIFRHTDQYSSRYLESCLQCFELVTKSYEHSLHRALWPSGRSRFYLEVCR